MNALTAAVDRWIERTFFRDVTYLRPVPCPRAGSVGDHWPSLPTSPGQGLPGLRPVLASGLDPPVAGAGPAG